MLRFSLIFAAIAVGPAFAAAADEAGTPKVDFNRDIRPILSDTCFACHGPDANKREADLRLDEQGGLFGDRGGYAAVVPGKAAESELFSRITAEDPTVRMPPADSGLKLAPGQIDLIRRWIEQGAEYRGHWAYIPPERPPAPDVDRPGFVRNGVDRFILAKLGEKGLEPSPEADRVTLIRRLSFDLTGLPPTPEEVDAFVNDPRPDAYERLVDRLLASPHFGERMAIYWLDLVRYADTNGIHGDNHRDVWLYRDYVIRAFNADKPFDQFTIEQIAGDLLENPSDWQRSASGYNRLLRTTREGGAQPKEYLAKYAADRVRNVSTVWLGSTMGCAECHDHKFDPISTQEFYSFAAFFADIKETAVGVQEPTKFPTPEQHAAAARLDSRIAELKRTLDTQTPELDQALARWEAESGSLRPQWTVLALDKLTSATGAEFKRQDDGSLRVTGGGERDTFTLTAAAPMDGITAMRLEVLPDDALPAKGPGRASNGNFVVHEVELSVEDNPAEWAAASATHSQQKFNVAAAIDGKGDTGWAILDQTGRENHAVFETKADLGKAGETRLTLRLVQNYGSHHTLGRFRVSVTAAPRPVRAEGADGPPQNVREILALEPDKRSEEQRRTLAAWYRTVAPPLQPVREELARVEAERKQLAEAMPQTLISVSVPPREMRVLPRGNWLDDSGPLVQPSLPAFQTSPESHDGRMTRLDLARWLVAAENPLTARVFVNRMWKLAFGHGLVATLDDFGSQGARPTHPELLDWLAMEFQGVESRESRVEGQRAAVSSQRSAVSGQQAADDRAESDPRSSTLGSRPSADPQPSTLNPQPTSQPSTLNPQPLWSIKRLVRLIVTSGTYRQSSHGSPALAKADPGNRWYARQTRFRLPAETVRDTALATSGLLVHELGGPSVKPYQPAGYWAHLNFPTREWQHDTGRDQYRRGLYTYWCRTFLHPSLLAFDAATREECTVERPRSNTPLQALALLNDTSYVEASRMLAARILSEGGSTATERLNFACRLVLSRPPRPQEAAVLTELLEKHAQHYAAERESAADLLKVGLEPAPNTHDPAELAAWTSIARVILNLHEALTRQ
ncbi:MAG: PSD1 and planctomycete cytochrome C domain-containing protein [Planctomycetes bacterium]|nr:PSD1 and planctomycete cytochrome C domain-containing protein [Planctomycetota bacterium]